MLRGLLDYASRFSPTFVIIYHMPPVIAEDSSERLQLIILSLRRAEAMKTCILYTKEGSRRGTTRVRPLNATLIGGQPRRNIYEGKKGTSLRDSVEFPIPGASGGTILLDQSMPWSFTSYAATLHTSCPS
jgi:hypothetical protein